MIEQAVVTVFGWPDLDLFSGVSWHRLLVGTAFVLWLSWLWQRRHIYRFMWRRPGPLGLPLIGLFYDMRVLTDTLPFFQRLYDKYKTYTVYTWMGTQPVILSSDPNFIEKILKSNEILDKAHVYKILDTLGGFGLLSSTGHTWQTHRKRINPSFSHQVLLKYSPAFYHAQKNLLRKFELLANDNKCHGLMSLCFRTSITISVENILGKRLQEGNAFDEELVESFDTAFRNVTFLVLIVFLKLDFLHVLNRKLCRAKNFVHNFVTEVINQKISYLKSAKHDTEEPTHNEDDSIKKKPAIFIDQLLKYYELNEFTFDDVHGEAMHMFAASFETTGLAMFSTLVMIAMHPQVQEKLFEELLSVFPSDDVPMEFEHMKDLPYLEMVIKESLRLCPPPVYIGRRVVQDTQLCDDCIIPKGVEVILGIYQMHRRTDIWGPNAAKFDPDHFLPHKENALPKYAYMPFSGGLRNCIGWRYALLLLSTVIAGVVRNYKLDCEMRLEDLQFNSDVTMRYKNEPLIKVTKRVHYG